MRMLIELTPKQLDMLSSRNAIARGREEPRKPWTQREKVRYAKEWLQCYVEEQCRRGEEP